MKIIVNTRNDYPPEYYRFLREVFSRLAANQPKHEFIFLFDRSINADWRFGSNVLIKSMRFPFSWNGCSNVMLPVLMHSEKADVFVSTNGMYSLLSSVRQCLILPGAIARHPSHFFDGNTSRRAIEHSDSVCSLFPLKQDVKGIVPAEKNIRVSRGIFQSMTISDSTAIKKQYTDGREYFLCVRPGTHCINILKAFSLFKKRQQSNYQLVLADLSNADAISKSLENYKFRDEVRVVSNAGIDEIIGLVSGSYCLVCTQPSSNLAFPLLEAIQMGVPVIGFEDLLSEDLSHGAAMWVPSGDTAELGEKMMRVYKDEVKRKEMIEKGKNAGNDFSWGRTTELIWNCIQKAVAHKNNH